VLGYQTLKGSRYLLLTGGEKLTEEKRDKLAEALRFNEPLSTAYYLKEELRLLWSRGTRDSMRRFLERWIARALGSPPQISRVPMCEKCSSMMPEPELRATSHRAEPTRNDASFPQGEVAL
jgi:transposase